MFRFSILCMLFFFWLKPFRFCIIAFVTYGLVFSVLSRDVGWEEYVINGMSDVSFVSRALKLMLLCCLLLIVGECMQLTLSTSHSADSIRAGMIKE